MFSRLDATECAELAYGISADDYAEMAQVFAALDDELDAQEERRPAALPPMPKWMRRDADKARQERSGIPLAELLADRADDIAETRRLESVRRRRMFIVARGRGRALRWNE